MIELRPVHGVGDVGDLYTISERGRHIGHVRYVIIPPRGAVLTTLTIAPRLRGTGYGRRVMERIEGEARGQGVPRIELQDVRPEARGFWTRIGYAPDEEGRWNKAL